MPGLSLMQTRSFIDRLGDLDEEITKVCRAADVMSKGAGKEHSAGVGRLKEACDALQDKQKFVRDAKDCLLGLDGFMHALSGEMRQLMEHPEMGNAVGRVSERMQAPLGAHVATIVEETVDGLRRVSAAVKALREAREDAKRAGSIKESAQALSKVCAAAENALKKALKHAESPPKTETVEAPAPQSGDEEVVVEEMVEKAAHGYDLTAGLPPEFLENAQKKKDEAAGKKDDDKDDDKKKAADHGYDLTAGEMPDFIKEKMKDKDDQDEAADKDDDEKAACKKADSLTPGNESKGPKDEGEEDQGWVPGHRTTQKPTDEKESSKKATPSHGYDLTADSKDPDPSMDDDLPGEDTDGEPVVDKSAKGKVPDAFLKNIEKMKAKGKGDKKDDDGDDKKDDAKDSGKPWEKDKKADDHGYDLVEAPDHGYNLTA
jgi:hypothetical protein